MWGTRLTTQKQAASFGVGRDTLKKRKGVTDTIRSSRGQLRRIEQRVDRDDLLEEGGHDT